MLPHSSRPHGSGWKRISRKRRSSLILSDLTHPHPKFTGAGDDGMGVATPTAPAPAPASPRPPPRAAIRSSSTGRPAQPPPARTRATSAPPAGDTYPEVVLLKLPVPRTEVAVRKWLDPILDSATALPADCVLPLHAFVTLTLRTVKDAGAAAASLPQLSPTFEVAPGDNQRVVVTRSGPPAVRR